ncbi:MAG: helix-turn-helix transcriptional regulator [Candidatus Aenigmatarchaeota archaeon]|nr:MAG: helix-turn-helix transcriptional regulator [Candidatus Aenigmarchaeota archaeon]
MGRFYWGKGEAALAKIDYLKVLGENIKRIRLRKPMSQAELARKSGVGKSTLYAVEQGRPISIVKLLKIADALEIHPSDLFLSDKDREEVSYKHKLLIEKIGKFFSTD